MNNFFKNNIEFKEDTVLRVNFKYSLELSRRKVAKTLKLIVIQWIYVLWLWKAI